MLNPQMQPRELIAEKLWPRLPHGRSRRNVSDTLYRLRQQTQADWFWVEKDQLGLHPDFHYWLDVAEFEKAVDAVAGKTAVRQELETAVSLYQGELLPELYEDWLLEPRLRLREMFLTTLHRLGKANERENKQQEAYQFYVRLLQEDPLRESAYRGAMRCLAHLNRLTEALTLYRQLEQLLQEELGVSPTERSQLLAERLQKEITLRLAVQQQTQRLQVPFVGRVNERAQLLACLDKAYSGRGGIVTVLGEAGIGKSRLLDELAQAADWRGWQVAWGRGQEFDVLPPYTPLRQTMIAALPAPRLQQLAQMVRPLSLSLVAHILPHIHTVLDLPETTQITDRQQIELAFIQLLNGLQEIAPHLLILEDIHWADAAVWSLLDAIRPALHKMSLLVVVNSRLDDLRTQPEVWQQVQTWERQGETVIPLKGLSASELQELATTMQAVPLSAKQAQTVQKSSGGNPLIALHVLETAYLVTDLAKPSTLASLMAERVAAMSQVAQVALQAAAVIGYQFQYSFWEALIQAIHASQLPLLAGELEQAHLILLDETGYQFANDTLRATVYQAIPEIRRQQLHEAAFQFMRQHELADIHALLHHAEQANLSGDVGHYALLAGEEALSGFSYETAFSRFSQSIAVLPEEALSERYRALSGRIQAADILAQRETQKQDLMQLQSVAEQVAETALLAETARLHARFLLRTGDPATAVTIAKKGLSYAVADENRQMEAVLSDLLGQIVRQLSDYKSARDYVAHAQQLYHELGLGYGEALTTDLLGGLAWDLGDHVTAVHCHAEAAKLSHDMGNTMHEAMALNNLGSAYWSMGQYDQSRNVLEQALVLNRDIGHRASEADNLDNLGGIAWSLADYETAVSFYNQALTIRRQADDGWGISISLGNLGSTHRLMGKYEMALGYLAEALAVNQQMGRRIGEGYNYHGRGLTYLDMGKIAEADEALTSALAIRTDLVQKESALETSAGLLLVRLAQEDGIAARRLVAEILAQLSETHRTSLRQWIYYAAFCAYEFLEEAQNAAISLARAERAMLEIADPLPEKPRNRFLQRHPLNQAVKTAVAQHTSMIQLSLVRSEIPLGHKLTEADYTAVSWTVSAPGDVLVEKTAVRRHVL
ncbi:MAG: tetratricopeptide repeat protein [Aquificales bacterium]|nr:tetratricopeptide repeat protein [Aquificales bacterium]